jgi:hypothetical protein
MTPVRRSSVTVWTVVAGALAIGGVLWLLGLAWNAPVWCAVIAFAALAVVRAHVAARVWHVDADGNVRRDAGGARASASGGLRSFTDATCQRASQLASACGGDATTDRCTSVRGFDRAGRRTPLVSTSTSTRDGYSYYGAWPYRGNARTSPRAALARGLVRAAPERVTVCGTGHHTGYHTACGTGRRARCGAVTACLSALSPCSPENAAASTDAAGKCVSWIGSRGVGSSAIASSVRPAGQLCDAGRTVVAAACARRARRRSRAHPARRRSRQATEAA